MKSVALIKPARGFWALLALSLASCSSGAEDNSPESEFMERTVVPEIARWARSDSPIMPLGRHLASRQFNLLCIVPEYRPNSLVEDRAGEILDYHGSRGRDVPESQIAIIAIRGNSAHVAYLSMRDLVLMEPAGRCVEAAAAHIRRLQPTPLTRYTPRAILEAVR